MKRLLRTEIMKDSKEWQAAVCESTVFCNCCIGMGLKQNKTKQKIKTLLNLEHRKSPVL